MFDSDWPQMQIVAERSGWREIRPSFAYLRSALLVHASRVPTDLPWRVWSHRSAQEKVGAWSVVWHAGSMRRRMKPCSALGGGPLASFQAQHPWGCATVREISRGG